MEIKEVLFRKLKQITQKKDRIDYNYPELLLKELLRTCLK